MGKVHSAGVEVATGFKVKDPQPVDDRYVVDNIADLTAMEYAYVGISVFVWNVGKFTLVDSDSSTLANWKPQGTLSDLGDAASSVDLTDIENGNKLGIVKITANFTHNSHNYFDGQSYVYNGTTFVNTAPEPENYFVTDSGEISALHDSSNWTGDTYTGTTEITGFFHSDSNYIYYKQNDLLTVIRMRRYPNGKLVRDVEEIEVTIIAGDDSVTASITIPEGTKLLAWAYRVTDNLSDFDADLSGGITLNIATAASGSLDASAKSFESEISTGAVTLTITPSGSSIFDLSGEIKFAFYTEAIPDA